MQIGGAPRIAAGCLTVALAVGVGGVARADGIDSVGLLGDYMIPDDHRSADHGYGGTLMLSLPLPNSSLVHLEPNLYGETLSRSGGDSDTVIGLGADFRYTLLPKHYLEPFVIGGLGVEYDKAAIGDGSSSTAPYFDAGLGVVAPVNKKLSIRGDVRNFFVLNGNSYPGHSSLDDWRFRLGLQYSFGGFKGFDIFRTHENPETQAQPVAVVPPSPPPATPPPPLCPAVPGSIAVDADGCIIEQTVALPEVQFASSNDQLTPDAQTALKSFAEALIQEPDLNVEVDGHTDSSGSQAKNLLLSQQRAAAVRDFLVQQGVAAGRLSAEGFGPFRPVADNKTPAGRAKNRRVEFRISKTQ